MTWLSSGIRFLTVAVVLWGGTVGLPKELTEVADVIEAAVEGDLGNGHVGGA